MSIETFLTLLVLLQAKHLVADFLFQTPRMLREKGIYGAPGGLMHAGLHALLSLPALLVVGVAPALALLVAAAEFVAHYHIDWTKERLGRYFSACPEQKSFWVLMGVDQFAHQLTYAAMIWGVAG